MNSEENFILNYRRSFIKTFGIQYAEEGEGLFTTFLNALPSILSDMQTDINLRNISDFYLKLSRFKHFIEYSDILNTHWYVLRAYSGGISRILEKPTVDNSQDVFYYYYKKYGDRRLLKDENWFEKKRWDFLEELVEIKDNQQLESFIKDKIEIINQYFDEYKAEVIRFTSHMDRILKS